MKRSRTRTSSRRIGTNTIEKCNDLVCDESESHQLGSREDVHLRIEKTHSATIRLTMYSKTSTIVNV